MIEPTPHPPHADLPASGVESLTAFHPFSPCQGDTPLLAVRAGMPVQEALIQACEYLKSVSAGAAEVVENSPQGLRPLARSVEHASEIARALVEACVAGLAQDDRS